TASDNASVTRVDVSVDGGAWQLASGTGSWSASWDSTTATKASHTISARATDSSGNAAAASVTVTVGNVAASPSPSPTSGTQMVTPEGTVINVNTQSSWTADQIYQKLKENGLNSTIGPTLTVFVQDTYASSVTASAQCCTNGHYSGFAAYMYL